jgi:hypothetical protein
MGTDKTVFVVERCDGATGSDRNSRDQKYFLRMRNQFPRFSLTIEVVQNVQ